MRVSENINNYTLPLLVINDITPRWPDRGDVIPQKYKFLSGFYRCHRHYYYLLFYYVVQFWMLYSTNCNLHGLVTYFTPTSQNSAKFSKKGGPHVYII